MISVAEDHEPQKRILGAELHVGIAGDFMLRGEQGSNREKERRD